MIKILLVLFLIGHVLGDFYLQSDELASSKKKSFSQLLEHGLIYFFSMTIILIPIFGFSFLKWVLVISLIHFLIDSGIFYLNRKQDLIKNNKLFFYILDQLLHFITILMVVLVISSRTETVYYTAFFDAILDPSYINIQSILNWMLAIAILIKPVSISINKILAQYEPTTVDEEEFGHPGAGSLIGILERLIILVMLSQNQYGAIGFVLTAKSIARYNKIAENPQFSEYYLLGTLLSMLLVILTHILIF